MLRGFLLKKSGNNGRSYIGSITKTILIPLIFYLLLSFVLTYPMGFDLNSLVLEEKWDTALMVWNLWWVNKSIGELHTSPFYTDYIFYPTGVSLNYHAFSFYNTLLGIPFVKYFGLIYAYNLLIILSFFIAGLGAFFLARNEGLGITASLSTGFIYGFIPYHFFEFSRFDYISIHWIPFATLFILRLCRGGKLLDGIMSGILLALVTLCSWYYGIFTILMFVCIFLYTLFFRRGNFRWKPFIINSLVQFGIFSLLIFPAAYPLIESIIAKKEAVTTYVYSTTWADLFGISRGTYGQYYEFAMAWPAILGYIASVFFLYALLKVKWDKKGLWVFLGAIFFILALGPRLIAGGYEVPFIRLPEVVFYYIPILSSIRSPYRFIVIASLAFAVIAGYGIDSFFKGIIARFRKPIPTLLISFLFFLMIAEVWIVPLPTKPVKIPEFYQNLGNKSENFALLEIPGNRDTWSTAMFYQTFHSKKIVGGHTGFNVPEYKFIENSPVISALAKMDIDKFKKDKQNFSEKIITTLQNMKIRYVIVNLKNWYYLKTGSFSGQKLKTGQPLYPLFLRGFPFKWDEPDKDILKLFLSSKERKDLENIFGTPIYLDKKIVAYNIL